VKVYGYRKFQPHEKTAYPNRWNKLFELTRRWSQFVEEHSNVSHFATGSNKKLAADLEKPPL